MEIFKNATAIKYTKILNYSFIQICFVTIIINRTKRGEPEEEIMYFMNEVHRSATNEQIEEPIHYKVGGFIDDEYPPLIANIAPPTSCANLTTNVTKVNKIFNKKALIQINKLKTN